MNSPAVITGVGLKTVLGNSAAQTWDALLAGRSVADHCRIAGIECADRACAIGQSAGAEALRQARWDRGICGEESTAFMLATSKGPIETWLTPQPSAAGGLDIAGVGQTVAELADSLGLTRGPRMTFSAACASGLHALIRAGAMIASGQARRVLVVATEASVHPLFIGSFQRLGVLAPEGFGCRPFDRRRNGFIMTEAGAAVCLEQLESNAAPALAGMDRWAVGSDAVHLTAGDPQGRCLRRLLERVIDGRRFDLLHAHGTATAVNDPVELAALEDTLPADGGGFLYSHKAALGHSLGAAGLVSIVINCLAHQNNCVPPNVRTLDPLPSRRVCISSTPAKGDIRRSLAIAAGFGGPLAVVSLIKA
jgi:3-oxoacyl-[acyl-carrier-protein] synthase II